MHVVVMGCVCQSLIKKLLTYLLTKFAYSGFQECLQPQRQGQAQTPQDLGYFDISLKSPFFIGNGQILTTCMSNKQY